MKRDINRWSGGWTGEDEMGGSLRAIRGSVFGGGGEGRDGGGSDHNRVGGADPAEAHHLPQGTASFGDRAPDQCSEVLRDRQRAPPGDVSSSCRDVGSPGPLSCRRGFPLRPPEKNQTDPEHRPGAGG